MLLFYNCNHNNDDCSLIKKIDKNGQEYYLLKRKDSTLLQIGLNKEGGLDCVVNFPKDYAQQIYYHKNGVIQSKLKDHKHKKATFGRALYFNPESGNLSGDFNYVDGVISGPAVTLFDSIGFINTIMLYNENGELYYIETYDEYGNLLKVEGNK